MIGPSLPPPEQFVTKVKRLSVTYCLKCVIAHKIATHSRSVGPRRDSVFETRWLANAMTRSSGLSGCMSTAPAPADLASFCIMKMYSSRRTRALRVKLELFSANGSPPPPQISKRLGICTLCSVLISHAQLLLQLNVVGLEEMNDCCTSHSLQLVTCLPDGPPQLRIPRVHCQALPRYVHRISRSLQFSFLSGVSPLTSPWSPLFLLWDHQFSDPHDGCGESGFHVVHIAVFRLVCPDMPSNRYGHLLSKLGVSHQAPAVRWWFSWGPQPAVRAKWSMSLTDAETMLWFEMGRKEG